MIKPKMEERVILMFICFSSVLPFIAGGFYWIIIRKQTRRCMTLAPGLRVFLTIMSALGFTMPLTLFLTSLYSLLGLDFFSTIGGFLRTSMLVSSQFIDFSALVISIDCAVASLTKNQNPLLKEKFHGYLAVVGCVTASFCIAVAFYISSYTVITLFAFTMSSHIVCFLTELVLLIINLRRHKIISSNYRLSSRHKLVRNIKLLQILCPYLFLGTILAASGTIPGMFYVKYKIISIAVGAQLVYFCYNTAFLSIIVIFIWTCYKQSKRTQVVDTKGEETAINHFQQLKRLWQ